MVYCSGKPVSSSIHFYPTALKGFGVLFSPMVSGWAGPVGRRENLSRPYLKQHKV